MTKLLALTNTSVFSNEDTLFFSKGDHQLMQAKGEQSQIVGDILQYLKDEPNPDRVFEQVKHKLDDDKELFVQIIDWLIANEIVTPVQATPFTKATIGIFSTLENNHILFNALSQRLQKFEWVNIENFDTDLEKATLTLVVAPIFKDYNRFLQLNKKAYKDGFTLFHLSMDNSSFTLGPISEPRFKSPCLQCYAKRKIVNFENPTKYLSFIESFNKNSLHLFDITKTPYFEAALNYLEIELNKYFITEGTYSSLIGRSITFDNFDFQVSRARVLKIPHCDVCNPYYHKTPVNI
ncbi:hypothetical protein DXZ20_01230 [Leptolyngbyaceae cyanobacterium CCMR0081]|uniref:Bacteriocin biosynthesis cyclodehydratase domain-containing protein n=1 Tax=Adonisia turfae CCMR0081 TaxID=2292702 RepID=A0A6M0RF14_9CYAN|nr:hypothetical protein [Adonisia turfae CCMR0081]